MDFYDDESCVVELAVAGEGSYFTDDASGDLMGGEIAVFAESFCEFLMAELSVAAISGVRNSIRVEGEEVVGSEIDSLLGDGEVGGDSEEASRGIKGRATAICVEQ